MRARWETEAGKLLSLVFESGVICSQLCPPSKSQMLLVCGLSKSCDARALSGSALVPQLRSGEGWKTRRGAAAGDIREPGQHQLVARLGREPEADRGQRAGFLLRMSVNRRMLFPLQQMGPGIT